MQPTGYDDIRAFIQNELERRRESPPLLQPSEYWKQFAANFAYVLRLDDAELRRIRYHCYHLTADLYQKYLLNGPALSRRLRTDYESIDRELGGFQPDEGDTGFGCDVGGRFISTDLLRYMQVLADLVDADVFPRDRVHRVLEIGGGYGGLASVCMTYNRDSVYLICDLEETMFFQAVHLANRFGFSSVELCGEEGALWAAPKPGRFYLLPQNRSSELASVSVDLAINQQSLQEMTEDQVRAYCALVKRAARFFYSCNLDAHREGVADRMGIVRNLHEILDREFPRTRWQREPPRGIAKLGERIRGQRRRSGDRKLRRVAYEIQEGPRSGSSRTR